MSRVSADLQWLCIRKTSSFIRRQRGVPKHFSTEKFNLKGLNSIRYNGLVHKKGINIEVSPDGKGIILSTKKKRKEGLPAKSINIIELKKDSRKVLKSVRNISARYRKSHLKLAERRASQLLRSLRPLSVRRGKRSRKMDVKLQ